MSDVLDAIQHPSRTHQNSYDYSEVVSKLDQGDPAVRHRTASTIWNWLVARRDISVGLDRKYNHLALEEVLVLTSASSNFSDGQDASIPSSDGVRVHASEETMWESLTGHAIDYKRVPKSEWLLLLGIASTTTQGILQGDLGRLVDQDKRSVPKRTDALLKKGYIAKRTTLVRGTKTSKMWLKNFAPALPKDGEAVDDPRPDMTLTRQVLVDNLAPVPWHIRWTGESIDYTALATTIMAVSKEWGVLRVTDLKAKLGVLGMRWQMKVLAKVCRFLNARGVIQYVAAKLGEKVFKDCIKYVRDFNSEDWSVYLATGKRQTKPPRNPDLDGLDGSKQFLGQSSSASEILTAPPWSLDKPIPITIAEMAQRLGDTGLTNPDVYAFTLGSSFSRHLSSMTTALSVPNLQPSHLRHLQIRSEHSRNGKIASYRYFAEQHPPTTISAGSENVETTDPYGFSSVSASSLSSNLSPTWRELCKSNQSARKPLGRPRKANPKPQPKKRKEVPKAAGKKGTENQASRVPQTPQTVQNDRQELATQAETAVTYDETSQPNDVPTQDKTPPPETAPEVSVPSEQNRPEEGTQAEDKFLVTLKASSEAVLTLATPDQSATPTPVCTRSKRSTRLPTNKDPMVEADVDAELDETKDADENEVGTVEEKPTGPKKRGRPRKVETKKNKGKAAEGDEADSDTRPWSCEKCGGSWKNDIGLKYHLEKSRTACNPSFDASAAPTRRGGKKRILTEIEDAEKSAPVDAEPPASEEKNKDGDGSDKEEQGRESEEEYAHTFVARWPKKRGPIAARPSFSSQPTVSLKGSSLPANTEWRRPPMTSFDTPQKPSFTAPSNGALVQDDSGQLRPVLGSFNRLNSASNIPKTPHQQPRVENQSAVTEAPQENVEPNPEGSSMVLREDEAVAKLGTPVVTDSLLPKATLNHRISEIVKGLIAEQSGVFPGEQPLWYAITIRWKEQFPDEINPLIRTYQAVLREMMRSKTVTEHCHAFRDTRGIFAKCTMMMQAGLDPFSPEANDMLENIKQAHPEPYYPPPFVAPTGPVKRGRRALADEVEVLNAPIYAAQSTIKRTAHDVDDDELETPRVPRRYKKRVKIRDRSPSPSLAARRKRLTWAPAEDLGDYEEPSWDGQNDPYTLKQGSEPLRFLEPNTCLGVEREREHDPKQHKRRRLVKAAGQSLLAIAGEVEFQTPVLVSGSDGFWPSSNVIDFENHESSYTLEGWMPDMTWFAWSTMEEEIEHRTPLLDGRKRYARLTSKKYERFVQKLQGCIETERAWIDSFVSAQPGAAGPHNIFIMFFGGTTEDIPHLFPLSWSPLAQLTPQTFQESAHLDPRLLGEVEEKEKEEEESSSGEDDSLDWPGLPGTAPKPTTIRRQSARSSRIKRVRLVTRSLTSLPARAAQAKEQDAADGALEETEKLLAAFIATRVLLGGADKAVDWGLLLKLFPKIGLTQLRRFWTNARKDQGAYIGKLTKDFQERFLIAYEKDELPEIDFDDPMEYDWHGIIEWTLQLPRRKGLDLPSTRPLINERFFSQDTPHTDEDWREKFFHPQASVFSRFESTTAKSVVVTVDKMLSGVIYHVDLSDSVIAKSWIKSLCCTDEARYSPDQIKQKFATLAKGDQDQNNTLLKQAIDDLTHDRIICRSKKPPLGGRPYRLNEWYSQQMVKLSQRTKYQEAANFKTKLDLAFRRGEPVQVPYTLDDGSVMALTNLNAAQRIRLVPVDVPHIPLGFEPGNYESRKYPKSYYHFGIEAVPTETYKYDEDIPILRKTINEGPPGIGPRGELPQWIDFFGRRDAQRWMDILGAFCFISATRGYLTIEGMCSALKPVLEEYEAQLIIDWGKRTGVLVESEDGLGTIVEEWWWLAVPWQSGRQLKYRRQQDDD